MRLYSVPPSENASALDGSAGRVAIGCMEWSGRNFQRIHLPIRNMSTQKELAQFAEGIRTIPDDLADPMCLQATSIGKTLLAAEQAVAQLDVRARVYVVNIFGGGIEYDGTPVSMIGDQLVALGPTVNGFSDSEKRRHQRFSDHPAGKGQASSAALISPATSSMVPRPSTRLSAPLA